VRKDAVDEWQKELAPSLPLLQSYRAGRLTWPEFARRYRAEVRQNKDILESVRELSRRRMVTLLCGCENESRCHRGLLKKIVESK
jgi:uncharacterized protein YeaO (DUF488 family)